MKLGANAYRLRDISFELMLLIRGFVHFDYDSLDMDHPIYESTVFRFNEVLRIKLVELAVHQRNLDDEFNNLVSDPDHLFHMGRSAMEKYFIECKYAFDSISNLSILKLREVSNKIIHADKFKLEAASEIVFSTQILAKIGMPDLARVSTLTGKKGQLDWCVHFDMLAYCEQNYLFAEILAERYGI